MYWYDQTCKQAACRSHKAKRTGNGEPVTIFLCSARHCITASLAPLWLDYLPAKQKQAGCLLWAVSCEDKIRWEIFRPLSSHLNSAVVFCPAPHEKENVVLQGKYKQKTREKEGNRVVEVCNKKKQKSTTLTECQERWRHQRETDVCVCVCVCHRGESKSLRMLLLQHDYAILF